MDELSNDMSRRSFLATPALPKPMARLASLGVLDHTAQQQTIRIFGKEALEPFPGSVALSLAIDAPLQLDRRHHGQSLTFFLDRPAVSRPLPPGYYQLLPPPSSRQGEFSSWSTRATHLLEASLTGSGPVELALDDLSDVLAQCRSQRLRLHLLDLQQPLPHAGTRFRNLFATLFCAPDCSYDAYLDMALMLAGHLPPQGLLRLGMIHHRLDQPVLMLLGDPRN